MKIKLIYIIIALIVLGVVIFLLTRKPKIIKDKVTKKIGIKTTPVPTVPISEGGRGGV